MGGVAGSGKGYWEIGSLHFFSFAFSKIFILNDLPSMDPAGSAQNIDPQGLTAKIFQNKDLACWQSRTFFFVTITKLLIMNDLGSLVRNGSGQSIEPQGLTRKLFWNKGLPVSEGSFRLLNLSISPKYSF
jgi:hypothetical protein